MTSVECGRLTSCGGQVYDISVCLSVCLLSVCPWFRVCHSTSSLNLTHETMWSILILILTLGAIFLWVKVDRVSTLFDKFMPVGSEIGVTVSNCTVMLLKSFDIQVLCQQICSIVFCAMMDWIKVSNFMMFSVEMPLDRNVLCPLTYSMILDQIDSSSVVYQHDCRFTF